MGLEVFHSAAARLPAREVRHLASNIKIQVPPLHPSPPRPDHPVGASCVPVHSTRYDSGSTCTPNFTPRAFLPLRVHTRSHTRTSYAFTCTRTWQTGFPPFPRCRRARRCTRRWGSKWAARGKSGGRVAMCHGKKEERPCAGLASLAPVASLEARLE